ncbi:hypothetical protein METBIDRAFT_78124 [Metschnikowia bicuspidata var. bicuspidata NRRL YB-4993]|uniref:Uncharacterized protein n=1 Tax=Metschnikowia bicuspidata var. bicuspidata NRRL YB-4993 TaxID=869754 RepID=A0A1A0HA73_9ASCO|nr:hypothetical protein METBIDRAFT_78124 [Metschnikowia bicuspidata var. bicuspidata NRRL YB-4993]OBA21029.1 hypothetical protein METBIDRAFT_78124 [Metschnikowia bicuspidata var. bicuspidata NRRL YB-4993]
MSQSLDIEQDAPGAVRSPRQSRAQRPTLAGLDLDPEGEDDEYNEEFEDTAIKDEDDDELDEEGDAEEDAGEDAGEDAQPPKKKRGRKRKAATQEPEDAGGEAGKAGGKLDTAGEDEDGDRAKAGPADGDKAGPGRKKGKKRGRKPKIPRPEDVIFDDKGNEINVQNDEVVLEDEDPQGRAKIDELGFLQGGRTFRIKTFTLLGKGERQYMVSTEPARLVGFRDSYLLFKTHLTLFKKVCTHDEKMDLINRQLIPTSYKGRAVNLVTARSIFREFGARMLVGGKKVTDDFWEQKARDRGDVEGDPADPEEAAVKVPSYNAADHNAYLAQVTGSALINYQTDATWMYQVAQQTVDYNKQLADARAQAWLRGVKDTYSGFNFYPAASQPRRAQLAKLRGAADDRSFDCTVRFFHPNVRRTATGLANVPRDVLDCIEDGAVKRAVLEQQQFERSIQH